MVLRRAHLAPTGILIVALGLAGATPASAHNSTGALIGGLVAGALIGGVVSAATTPPPPPPTYYYGPPRAYAPPAPVYGPGYCGAPPYPPCRTPVPY
ncbi:hypothetical protein [Bosea sp. 117]|uniref:hypothetical protein n=1 Tax=Bosea sp. 117 TaxID=1125973 RepID=UPI000494A6B6|nr:hypothetical protein [Bosea sp. 117]